MSTPEENHRAKCTLCSKGSRCFYKLEINGKRMNSTYILRLERVITESMNEEQLRDRVSEVVCARVCVCVCVCLLVSSVT
jgi:hypothetical protein